MFFYEVVEALVVDFGHVGDRVNLGAKGHAVLLFGFFQVLSKILNFQSIH
jgi:hypothetical protein